MNCVTAHDDLPEHSIEIWLVPVPSGLIDTIWHDPSPAHFMTRLLAPLTSTFDAKQDC